MPIGPGKYDRITTFVREQTQAKSVIVMVFSGNDGTGFSMQSDTRVNPIHVAESLEIVAREIRESMKG